MPVTKKARPTSKATTAKKTELTDWRDEVLGRMRSLIQAADPKITEEVKWRKPTKPEGVAVWSRDGMICTGEPYKDKVKFTFAKGASLADPSGLFNADDNGKVRRAIDVREGDTVDEKAFKTLVKAAVALNGAGKKK